MLKELLLILWDTVRYGDLAGYVSAWLEVVTGHVTPTTIVIPVEADDDQD